MDYLSHQLSDTSRAIVSLLSEKMSSGALPAWHSSWQVVHSDRGRIDKPSWQTLGRPSWNVLP